MYVMLPPSSDGEKPDRNPGKKEVGERKSCEDVISSFLLFFSFPFPSCSVTWLANRNFGDDLILISLAHVFLSPAINKLFGEISLQVHAFHNEMVSD